MPVSVSLDAPSGRPGLVLRYLSAVSLDKEVLHNSLPIGGEGGPRPKGLTSRRPKGLASPRSGSEEVSTLR